MLSKKTYRLVASLYSLDHMVSLRAVFDVAGFTQLGDFVVNNALSVYDLLELWVCEVIVSDLRHDVLIFIVVVGLVELWDTALILPAILVNILGTVVHVVHVGDHSASTAVGGAHGCLHGGADVAL